jgi:hypothetical protein
MGWCPGGGCAKRRKNLKKYLKTVFKGKESVQVSEENVITDKFVDKMNAKYGKKRT